MVLELRQQLKLAQKLVMTPQLRQAIKLLQLNRLELTDALQAEIEQNPLLEESTEESDFPTQSDASQVEEPQEIPEKDFTSQVSGDTPTSISEVNWADYENNFDSDFSFAREKPPADAPSQFDFISAKPGLSAYMQWQLADLDLDEKRLDIALFIIGNLDRHGFFRAELDDICSYAGCDEEGAEEMLQMIQSLDPPGIAARDIRESLLLQLERKDLDSSLAYQIVKEHMSLLEARNHALIARKMGIPLRSVTKEIEIITSLTPYPGNEYGNEDINYVVPDVYVYIYNPFLRYAYNKIFPLIDRHTKLRNLKNKMIG